MRVACGAVALLAASMLFSTDSVAQQDFNGYPCLDDCSGHQAGYDWAESHGITDPYDCGGNSQSFVEGCKSYAEESDVLDEEDESSYEELESDGEADDF